MKQVADFGQHTHWNHYRLAILAPPFHNPFVPGVTGVNQRVEWSGVRDYGHACGSRQSRSSIRADAFFFPLANRPVTDGRRAAPVGSARYLAIASRTSEATLTFLRSAALLRSRRIFASKNRLVRFMHTYYQDVCLWGNSCAPTAQQTVCHSPVLAERHSASITDMFAIALSRGTGTVPEPLMASENASACSLY
jgi:hypothetical protein